MSFEITAKDKETSARAGVLKTSHGDVLTPAFFPVGTQAAVKALTCRNLEDIGIQGILSNSYHLYLRPGTEVISQAGGLHKFMGFVRTIITDSGGYQVFSLAGLKKTSDSGVEFQSHIDGSRHFLTPQKVIDIQLRLRPDIFVCLDECIRYPASFVDTERALKRTLLWASLSRKYFFRQKANLDYEPFLLGVIQGGTFEDLRKQAVLELLDLGFEYFSLGGLSVGEPFILRAEVVEMVKRNLPENKFAYLMGVGKPEDILEAVERGVDLFDCILPTRLGRTGTAFTDRGKVVVRNSLHKQDSLPIDPECQCWVCRRHSRSYIRHLINSGEMLGGILLSYHNVYWYNNFMRRIRQAIQKQQFRQFKKDFLAKYRNGQEDI